MHLFYTPEIDGDTHVLSPEESKHCTRVLRLSVGDIIFLVDGRGGFYKAEIIEADVRQTVVNVIEKQTEYGKRDFYLHIAIAPTKNIDRTEWFIEKAVELGIDEITPLICDRSERRDLKVERLEKIISSAVKQSIKAYYPKLNLPIHYKDFISRLFSGPKLIAHCQEGNKPHLKEVYQKGSNALLLIGPEGDFTPNEIALASNSGYQEISLGRSRLRTETAALYACMSVHLINA